MLIILKKIIFSFLIITSAWVLLYRFVNPPITWLMVQRSMERQSDGKSFKMERKWLNYDELSTNLKRAALAGEDAGFMNHWGFDFKSIQRAYEKNQRGRRVSGGSTITQQTAKNVFLWPSRSWVRKGFEAYITMLIEILWSKQRILEVYLNVIEMGEGIYGAEAATQAYYGKSAQSLSKGQAAMLVAVLPNPLRWSPAKPNSTVYFRQSLILRNMRRLRNVPLN